MDLNPIGEPPSRGARWCPSCQGWLDSREHRGRRRCDRCYTALVRPMKIPPKPKAGELRPGTIAEFADPRDRYDPSPLIASLRTRLLGKYAALGAG